MQELTPGISLLSPTHALTSPSHPTPMKQVMLSLLVLAVIVSATVYAHVLLPAAVAPVAVPAAPLSNAYTSHYPSAPVVHRLLSALPVLHY